MQRRFGDNLDQVAVALVILSQHDQMVVAVAFRRGAMVLFLADIKFAAKDRLHTRFLRRIDERHRAKDVAMIGHGHRRHVELFDTLDQALDVASAVEH